MDQIIFGVVGNAAYDAVKATWQRVTRKSLEDLYVGAFANAVEELKPILLKYATGGDVALDRVALSKVLHQDLSVNVSRTSLSYVRDEAFVQRLAQALAEQAVLIIGSDGSSLDHAGYVQLVHNVIRHAHDLFRKAIEGNEATFRTVLLEEAAEHGARIDEVHQYLEHQFGQVITWLVSIDGKLDKHSDLLQQSLQAQLQSERTAREQAERELEQLKNRIPNISFGFYDPAGAKDVLVTSRASIVPQLGSPDQWLSDDTIAGMVEQKRANIEARVQYGRELRAQPRSGFSFPISISLTPTPTERQIDEYAREGETIVRKYEARLRMYRVRHGGYRCQIGFVLYNEGSVSATDVEVMLVFPEGSYLIDFDEEGNEYDDIIALPSTAAPMPPWELSYAGSLAAMMPSYTPPAMKPTYPSGPIIDDWERDFARYTHPNLRPKEDWDLPPVVCYVPPSVGDSFQIQYEVKSNDLPDPLRGHLDVILGKVPNESLQSA